MLRAFTFGFGALLAWGLWRQASGPNGSNALLVAAFVAALVLAYYAGRRRRGASAVAVATATAISEATATADARQAVVVNLSVGAREVAAATYGGLDRVEWIGPPEADYDIDAIEDGGTLADIAEPPTPVPMPRRSG